MTLRAFLKNFFHVTDEEFNRCGAFGFAKRVARCIGTDDSSEMLVSDDGDWFFIVREKEISCMFAGAKTFNFREVSCIHGEDVNLIKNAAMQLSLEGVL